MPAMSVSDIPPNRFPELTLANAGRGLGSRAPLNSEEAIEDRLRAVPCCSGRSRTAAASMAAVKRVFGRNICKPLCILMRARWSSALPDRPLTGPPM